MGQVTWFLTKRFEVVISGRLRSPDTAEAWELARELGLDVVEIQRQGACVGWDARERRTRAGRSYELDMEAPDPDPEDHEGSFDLLGLTVATEQITDLGSPEAGGADPAQCGEEFVSDWIS